MLYKPYCYNLKILDNHRLNLFFHQSISNLVEQKGKTVENLNEQKNLISKRS